MSKPTPCLVRWKDPKSSWGWKNYRDVVGDTAEIVESLGWYAGEDDESFFIAMDWSSDECNTHGVIPKRDVCAIVFLPLKRGWGKGMTGPEPPKKEEAKPLG